MDTIPTKTTAEPTSAPIPTAQDFAAALAKADKKKRSRIAIPVFKEDDDVGFETLEKSLGAVLDRNPVQRLAFDRRPQDARSETNYRRKTWGVPATMAKRIVIQDDLVAAIIQARASYVQQFGRPRADRFSVGFVLDPKVGITDKLNDAQKADLDKRIEQAVKLLESCGQTDGWNDLDRLTFSQYLAMAVRSALTIGYLATELIWTAGDLEPALSEADVPSKKFHSFRPLDAGTIFRSSENSTGLPTIRQHGVDQARELEGLKPLGRSRGIQREEYAWVQVIDGTEQGVYAADEVVCHSFYPIADVEYNGYPLCPLDTVISAVTTHLNITHHNRIYFQSGRAARGMLVFQSEDVDDGVVQSLQAQFQAVINGVKNAWRLPVFGIGKDDVLTWQPLDPTGGGRDMEFQYLTDMNARIILSAFQMSPDELAGWGYLSKGTNNQALSESNNEYKLEAARDTGIRPLLAQIEDFVQTVILPLVAPGLEELVQFRLKGLDADTPEKEATRLSEDIPLHMTQDDVQRRVEKKPLGRRLGGEFPLAQAWQQVVEKYLYFGVILEEFFDVKGASKDPALQFIQNPMWFQWQQILMQKEQMAQQQQAAAQQQMAAQQQGQAQAQAPGANTGPGQEQGGPQPSEAGVGDEDRRADTGRQQVQQVEQATGHHATLERSMDEALTELSKGEQHLSPGQRKLLARHRKTVRDFMVGFKDDAERTKNDILIMADHLMGKHGAS